MSVALVVTVFLDTVVESVNTFVRSERLEIIVGLDIVVGGNVVALRSAGLSSDVIDLVLVFPDVRSVVSDGDESLSDVFSVISDIVDGELLNGTLLDSTVNAIFKQL